MRDVGVWKIVRLSGMVAGSAFVLSGCISCIEVSSVNALALPSIGTVQTLAVDTTTTLKKVVALPQKTVLSPASTPVAPSPPTMTHQPTAMPAKSSSMPSTPASASTSMPSPPQSSATPGYDAETFDGNLMQPFILADATRWPYAIGFTHPTSQRATVRAAFIEATRQGWRIGGILWYWWIGLVGLIAVAIHERIYFIPRHLRHGV